MGKIKLTETPKKKRIYSEVLKKEEIQRIFATSNGLIVDRSKLSHIILNNPFKSIIHTLLEADIRVEITGYSDNTMGDKIVNFKFFSYKKYDFPPYPYIYKGVASRDLDCSMVKWKFDEIFEIENGES